MNKIFFLFKSNTNITTIHMCCTDYLVLQERKAQAPPHTCAVCLWGQRCAVAGTEINLLLDQLVLPQVWCGAQGHAGAHRAPHEGFWWFGPEVTSTRWGSVSKFCSSFRSSEGISSFSPWGAEGGGSGPGDEMAEIHDAILTDQWFQMLSIGMPSVSLLQGADSLQVLSTLCCGSTALISTQSTNGFLQIKVRSWCSDQACGGQILPCTKHLSTLGTEDVWSRQDASHNSVFLAGIICFRQQSHRTGIFPISLHLIQILLTSQ